MDASVKLSPSRRFRQITISFTFSDTKGGQFNSANTGQFVRLLHTEPFVKELHLRMYDDVWKWAGKFRTTNINIGVGWQLIPVSLKQLLDDCAFWIENKTYPEDEIAVRFSHRIVSIHCFPNGNGRHSRMIADVIISQIWTRRSYHYSVTKQNDHP